MAVFTDAEFDYLATQRRARLATASSVGEPDVSAVGFGVEGDSIVSGGFEITKTHSRALIMWWAWQGREKHARELGERYESLIGEIEW